jgi:hypothetical protein
MVPRSMHINHAEGVQFKLSPFGAFVIRRLKDRLTHVSPLVNMPACHSMRSKYFCCLMMYQISTNFVKPLRCASKWYQTCWNLMRIAIYSDTKRISCGHLGLVGFLPILCMVSPVMSGTYPSQQWKNIPHIIGKHYIRHM